MSSPTECIVWDVCFQGGISIDMDRLGRTGIYRSLDVISPNLVFSTKIQNLVGGDDEQFLVHLFTFVYAQVLLQLETLHLGIKHDVVLLVVDVKVVAEQFKKFAAETEIRP